MSGIIYSTLLKANYLAGDSLIFPVLVRAACAYHGVPYSQAVVEYSATRPVVLSALEMKDDKSLDTVLEELARNPDGAAALDTVILTVVNEYKAYIIGEPNGNN